MVSIDSWQICDTFTQTRITGEEGQGECSCKHALRRLLGSSYQLT